MVDVKKIEKEIYITKDGKEFLDEKKAEKYEKEVLARHDNIYFFQIIHSPDLTEGRGSSGCLKVAVEGEYSTRCELMVELLAEQWFGSRVAWVQGCSPTKNWFISEIKKKSYMSEAGTRVGDYDYKSKRIFISHKDLEGFPNATKYPCREGEEFPPKKEVLDNAT